MTPMRPSMDRTCARPRSGDRSDNGQDTEARRARQGRASGERSERSLDVTEHFRMLAHRSGRAKRERLRVDTSLASGKRTIKGGATPAGGAG